MSEQEEFEKWLKSLPESEYPPHLRTATFAELMTLFRKSKKKSKTNGNIFTVLVLIYCVGFWVLVALILSYIF